MCGHLVPQPYLWLCTPLQSCLCCYIILPRFHVCCVHTPKSIPFISSSIVYPFHFIDCSLPLSSLPYFVILMLHCHSVFFHVRLRNTTLLKYIHSWAYTKTYASKPDFSNITCSNYQNKNFGSSDREIQ